MLKTDTKERKKEEVKESENDRQELFLKIEMNPFFTASM